MLSLSTLPLWEFALKWPTWVRAIIIGYELLLSLLLCGLVRYLSTQGANYRFDKNSSGNSSAKYTKAAVVEDSQADMSTSDANPENDISRIEKDKKIESIDGYEI